MFMDEDFDIASFFSCPDDYIIVNCSSLTKILHLWMGVFVDVIECNYDISKEYYRCFINVGEHCCLDRDFYDETNFYGAPHVYYDFTAAHREIRIVFERLRVREENEELIAVGKEVVSRFISRFIRNHFEVSSIDKVNVGSTLLHTFDIKIDFTPDLDFNFKDIKYFQDITNGDSSLEFKLRRKGVLYLDF